MSIRLNEVHPTVVHYPLTLIPAAVIADMLGKATGSRTLCNIGRALMPIGAASAAVAGTAGLLAQGSANVSGEAKDLLVRHRTLNVGLIGVAATMAVMRAKTEKPGAGYLLAGLASLAAMSYTAYLGGKMVYDHGVGVKPAGGLRGGDAPEIHAGNLGEVAQESGRRIAQAAQEVAGDVKSGHLLSAH